MLHIPWSCELQESISHMEMAQGDTLFLPEQHANCSMPSRLVPEKHRGGRLVMADAYCTRHSRCANPPRHVLCRSDLRNLSRWLFLWVDKSLDSCWNMLKYVEILICVFLNGTWLSPLDAWSTSEWLTIMARSARPKSWCIPISLPNL